MPIVNALFVIKKVLCILEHSKISINRPLTAFFGGFSLLFCFMLQSRKRPLTHLLTGGLAIRKLWTHCVKWKNWNFLNVYLIDQLGRFGIIKFWNPEYYVIICLFSFSTPQNQNKLYILFIWTTSSNLKFRLPIFVYLLFQHLRCCKVFITFWYNQFCLFVCNRGDTV